MIGALLVKRMVPAAFEATNQHDIEAVLKNYSEDIIFVYPGDVSVSGTYHSKDEVRPFFKDSSTSLQRRKNIIPSVLL